MNPRLKNEMFETIYHSAMAKGALAATGHVPVPMVVEEHANMLDDDSPVVQQWYEPSGVCGFAWVVVKPGNSPFARWLKKHDFVKPHYYGGVSIWISGYGQCYEKKVVHAQAMAEYLRSVGIDAHAGDRLD